MDISSLKQIGPYVVDRFVDEGAFAWVFEVVDPKFAARRLALKMLKPEAAEGEEFRRFEAEARLLAQIDHPSVVTIFDFGKDEVTGNFFYVMTFVDGPTLKQRLKDDGPLGVEESLQIFVELLDGVAQLHEKGIVHRDIKPANVLLGRDGRARVADLGIARVQTERGQTRTGVAVGTALYMSPEQARGRPVDSRSDLFSVGLTLYETLTGNVIYDHVASVDSSSGMDVLMYIGSLVHSQSEFEVRFDSDDQVPPAIQRIILKALRLDVEERFPSAVAMRDALREALHTPVEHVVAPSGVSPRLLARLGAVAALLVALMGAYFFYWSPRQKAAEQRAEAARLIEEVDALSELAVAVASAAKDLVPAPAEALIEEVDDKLERADTYLEDGAKDLEAGALGLALKNLERGRVYHTASCQMLVDRFLTERADRADEALRTRALQLSDRGAQEVVADAWRGLAAVMPRTAAVQLASTGCEAAQMQLARIQAVAEGTPLADDVEREMAEIWPKLVEEAYENAVTARMVAVAQSTDAREYKIALKQAKRFLLQGSRQLKGEDHQAARDAYRSAERGFLVASAIVPAALARGEARELLEKALAEEASDLEEAGQLIARGDEAYTAEQWEESADLFKQGVARLKELRAANEWRRAAVKVQREADRARGEAVKEGAERSAPIEFAQAEVSMTDALGALEAEDAKRAELGFAAAREEYDAARKRAIQALRDAAMKRASVVLAGEKLVADGRCADLEFDEARGQCQQATSFLEKGGEALDQLDAPAAQRNFYAALESYARAGSAQALWEATRPRPPVLVRRVPQRAVVKVNARQLNNFAVEASDPNGDLLQYTWSIDGEAQPERGPTMKRRLEQRALVEVKVDDGKGGEIVERWQVEVTDRSGG